MAKGINKVMLIGHLGRDPEVRYSASGVAMCNTSVATTDGRKDKETGEWTDHTEWHQVVLLRRLAEVAGQYLRKGAKVYIEGRLQTRKYTDKTGTERTVTEVLANDMQMLDSRSDGRRGDPDDYGHRDSPPRGQGGGMAQPRPATPAPAAAGLDDDIPF